MTDLNITLVLPSGGARAADVPDDVIVHDLLSEFTSLLELPTVGPDGRPMTYRLDSKALGRELKDDEPLAAADIPEGDRLMLTADIQPAPARTWSRKARACAVCAPIRN